MKVRFTLHAEKQIKERNLTMDEMRNVLLDPDRIVQQEPGVSLFQKRYQEGGKEYLLRVAARFQVDTWIILTAYRTSKVEKYWGDKT